MIRRCPIPIQVSAYCDDVALILSQLADGCATFLSTLAEMLALVAQLRINYRKVRVIPLARSLVHRCIGLLAESDEAWREASETLSTRWLGYRLGPQSPGDEWGDVIARLDARASLVGSMGLGAPAAVRLALSVVWSVAFHALSVHFPNAKLNASFRALFQHLVKGPRGWMTAEVTQVATHLGWPASIPALDDLSLKLRLGVVSRLCDVNIVQLYKKACDDVQHPLAALQPFLLGWVQGGVLAALANAIGVAESHGVLVLDERDCVRFRAPFKDVVGTKCFGLKVAKLLRKRRDASLLPQLHLWLAKRLNSFGGAWASHYAMTCVLANLRKLRLHCPPRVMNAAVRCLTSGVSLDTMFVHTGQCLLSPSCGGRHTLEHYLWSRCWHTPRVIRRCGSGLACIEPFRRRSSLKLLIACANTLYLLCSAINLARTTLDVVPRPCEQVLLQKVARAGFRRGYRTRNL